MSTLTHHPHPLLATATAALLLTGLSAGTSSARPDPGPPANAPVPTQDQCLLERVGQQYVRCDDLTGNGAPAPAWIPQR